MLDNQTKIHPGNVKTWLLLFYDISYAKAAAIEGRILVWVNLPPIVEKSSSDYEARNKVLFYTGIDIFAPCPYKKKCFSILVTFNRDSDVGHKQNIDK